MSPVQSMHTMTLTAWHKAFYRRTMGLIIVLGVFTTLAIYYGPKLKAPAKAALDRVDLNTHIVLGVFTTLAIYYGPKGLSMWWFLAMLQGYVSVAVQSMETMKLRGWRKIFYRRTMGLIIVLGVFTSLAINYGLKLKAPAKAALDRVDLNTHSGELKLRKWRSSQHTALHGYIGLSLPGKQGWKNCKSHTRPTELEVDCGHSAQVVISADKADVVQCYQVRWRSLSESFQPHDCFFVGQAHWYGGAELAQDRWTIEKSPIRMQPFMSSHIGRVKGSYGSVLERYWLSSRGVAIIVDDDVPLHVGVNRSHLCLKADYSNTKHKNLHRRLPVLQYKICVGRNVHITHQYMSQKLFKVPMDIPDEAMFRAPIWSTWAQYQSKVNQNKVLRYAEDITRHGFKGCQIEIDDKYTRKYGDFTFDPVKFPDPLGMSKLVSKYGFRLTSWVTPFTNADSSEYEEGRRNGFWVLGPSGSVELVKWPQGHGALIDTTNPAAMTWMKKRLQKLKSQGIYSFKFDAGESSFLPKAFISHRPLDNPDHYSRLYVEGMYNVTGNRGLEVRVGYRSQHLPVMVRMMDKDSTWGYQRGLATLIPTALLFGLHGYPFVLPDMVGGNGRAGAVKGLPSKELYLRWVAATVLLPIVQFSIPPWAYDVETVNITRSLLGVRERHMEYILDTAREAARTGHPIIRPMWWVEPEDSRTYHIDDQFLVGQNLMVAPLLKPNVTSRDIYLPRGRWFDMNRNILVFGGKVLMNYRVGLAELPVFRRDVTSQI